MDLDEETKARTKLQWARFITAAIEGYRAHNPLSTATSQDLAKEFMEYLHEQGFIPKVDGKYVLGPIQDVDKLVAVLKKEIWEQERKN